MKRTQRLFFTFLIIFLFGACSGDYRIQGQVIEKSSSDPVEGALIQFKTKTKCCPTSDKESCQLETDDEGIWSYDFSLEDIEDSKSSKAKSADKVVAAKKKDKKKDKDKDKDKDSPKKVSCSFTVIADGFKDAKGTGQACSDEVEECKEVITKLSSGNNKKNKKKKD